jgi:hypothetical protein
MSERIIIKWFFKRHDRVSEWIDLAKDRDKWRTVVNKVMKLEGSIKWEVR